MKEHLHEIIENIRDVQDRYTINKMEGESRQDKDKKKIRKIALQSH